MALDFKVMITFYQNNQEYIVSKGDYLKLECEEIDSGIKIIKGIVETIDTFECGTITLKDKKSTYEFYYGNVQKIIEHKK